jgi:predicted Zn-dependent protease
MLIDATYSQSAEASADEFAHETLGEAGILPSSLADIFERLRKKHGDAEGIVAHFQAHPTLGDRIAAARAADATVSADIRPSLSNRDWMALQSVCN